jgi:hypothetical protein
MDDGILNSSLHGVCPPHLFVRWSAPNGRKMSGFVCGTLCSIATTSYADFETVSHVLFFLGSKFEFQNLVLFVGAVINA